MKNVGLALSFKLASLILRLILIYHKIVKITEKSKNSPKTHQKRKYAYYLRHGDSYNYLSVMLIRRLFL